MPNAIERNELSFSLTYLDHFEILNEAEGLNEPSGLSLSHDNKSLWVISDDTKKIFNLRLDGDLVEDKSFKIPDRELEGIVLDPTAEFLYTVKEPDNEIIKIKIDTQEVVDRQYLAAMKGFDSIKHLFSGGNANKGLEGITWNTRTGTIVVMKERDPGLLVEVSSNLKMIQSHKLLNDENGFRDTRASPDDIDFSDISYDHGRDCFWIISDKAKRLFLYDCKENKVIQSSKLGYGDNGEYREIKKAEGIAIAPDKNRLYLVSDEEARLYIYDIRE